MATVAEVDRPSSMQNIQIKLEMESHKRRRKTETENIHGLAMQRAESIIEKEKCLDHQPSIYL